MLYSSSSRSKILYVRASNSTRTTSLTLPGLVSSRFEIASIAIAAASSTG
jgi:hypothetical protein